MTGKLLGWSLCANISDHLRGGVEPDNFYQGTRMFSPGTRVYVGYCRGYDSAYAIGLRRVSRDWVKCIVRSEMLENPRATSVYSAALWARLEKFEAFRFPSKDEAQPYIAAYERARFLNGPDKLRPETPAGPWGPALRFSDREID